MATDSDAALRPLTALQQRFVVEYPTAPSAAEAARRAGYRGSNRALAVQASRNLALPNIASAIASHRKQLAAVGKVTDADIVAGLVTEARGLGPDSTPASRVAAWGKLAEIHGLTAGQSASVPAGLDAFLGALASRATGSPVAQLAPPAD